MAIVLDLAPGLEPRCFGNLFPTFCTNFSPLHRKEEQPDVTKSSIFSHTARDSDTSVSISYSHKNDKVKMTVASSRLSCLRKPSTKKRITAQPRFQREVAIKGCARLIRDFSWRAAGDLFRNEEMPARVSVEVERPAKGNVVYPRVFSTRSITRRGASWTASLWSARRRIASHPACYRRKSPKDSRSRPRDLSRPVTHTLEPDAPVEEAQTSATAGDEARTSKHVLRWCIRHHKTGALDFTACCARAFAHTRARIHGRAASHLLRSNKIRQNKVYFSRDERT